MFLKTKRYAVIALSVLGSATLLFSCGKKAQITEYDNETLMTESSENRTITMMENGKRSYTFTSPLMEGYRLATNPYQEFRRGIEMTTYTDSLSLPEVTITANYAIYYERQKLWEAKGNVVVVRRDREEGDTTVKGLTEVYTQQLFWNATTKKIYSNVDTKVLQADGWHFGVGFDADDDLKNIHFRRYSSEIEFDVSEPEKSNDTTKRISAAERANQGKAETKSESRGARKPSDKERDKESKSERNGGGFGKREDRIKPNFNAPGAKEGQVIRPSDVPKPGGNMQMEPNGIRPTTLTPERGMQPGSMPKRDAAKRNVEDLKTSKMDVSVATNRDLSE